LQNASDDPDPARDHDDLLPTDPVREPADDERTGERTGGHGGDDGTLGVRPWVSKRVLVGIVLAGVCVRKEGMWNNEGEGNAYAQHTGHGRDVQSEQASADTCKGAYDVLEKQ
jgi:hypothetical protein